MKILRSFPDDGGPPGRAHVEDDLERHPVPVDWDITVVHLA